MATDTAAVERKTYTILEVAEMIGVSKASIYNAVKRNEIPAIVIGNRIMCPKKAIDEMIATGHQPNGR